jgi:hypothetical protein
METNVTFSNTTNLIRCGKCADIHNAQLEGKTNKACGCDCHDTPKYIPYCPPYYDPCCPQIPSPTWSYCNGTAFNNGKVNEETTCHYDYNIMWQKEDEETTRHNGKVNEETTCDHKWKSNEKLKDKVWSS